VLKIYAVALEAYAATAPRIDEKADAEGSFFGCANQMLVVGRKL
jgi:hypothetical protein